MKNIEQNYLGNPKSIIEAEEDGDGDGEDDEKDGDDRWRFCCCFRQNPKL